MLNSVRGSKIHIFFLFTLLLFAIKIFNPIALPDFFNPSKIYITFADYRQSSFEKSYKPIEIFDRILALSKAEYLHQNEKDHYKRRLSNHLDSQQLMEHRNRQPKGGFVQPDHNSNSSNLEVYEYGCPIYSEKDMIDFSLPQYIKSHQPRLHINGLFNQYTTDPNNHRAIFFHPMKQFHHTPVITFPKKFAHFSWAAQADAAGGVALFRHAFVTGESAQIYNCHLSWFPGGCVAGDKKEKIQPFNTKPKIYLNGTTVLLHQFWGNNIFHHLIEDLPRITMLYEYIQSHRDIHILTYEIGNLTRAIFDLIDVPYHNIVAVDRNIIYFTETLLVPVATICGLARKPAVIRFRDLMRQKLGNPSSGERPLIVVQRRDPEGNRCVVNHEAMFSAIKSAFPTADVIEYRHDESVASTIDKHSRATVIIGPHGGGMSNVIFAPEGVGVVELHPRVGNWNASPNQCHEFTARALNANYEAVISSDNKITVDIEKVIQACRRVLSSN